jgi:CDP-diacylglycerol--glycerol-3-phosphate 3-phosphatidyltransferase
MTTANKITIFRILLVPFFIVQMLYYVSTGNELFWLLTLLAFALAALSDGVDGYIARHYNQKSELGKILDPIADKLLMVSAIILLSIDHGDYFAKIPLWLTGIIIGRDMIILIGFAVIHHALGKTVVRTRVTGKIATVFQMGTVIWILFRWTERVVPYWVLGAAFFTALSGALYILDGIRQLNASPSSAAAKEQ